MSTDQRGGFKIVEFEFELARTFVLLTSTKTVELFNEMLICISFA